MAASPTRPLPPLQMLTAELVEEGLPLVKEGVAPSDVVVERTREGGVGEKVTSAAVNGPLIESELVMFFSFFLICLVVLAWVLVEKLAKEGFVF